VENQCLSKGSFVWFFEQGDGGGGDGAAGSDFTESFVRFGFDVDGGEIDVEHFADASFHLSFDGREIGLFGVDGEVDVDDLVIFLSQAVPDNDQQFFAVGVSPSGVCIRKEGPDVAETGGSEQGVDNGVQGSVAVTVAGQAGLVGYENAAEHQFSFLLKAMDIGSDAGSVFKFAFVDHSRPFVLGRSFPVILTASASACPRALKTASAM